MRESQRARSLSGRKLVPRPCCCTGGFAENCPARELSLRRIAGTDVLAHGPRWMRRAARTGHLTELLLFCLPNASIIRLSMGGGGAQFFARPRLVS